MISARVVTGAPKSYKWNNQISCCRGFPYDDRCSHSSHTCAQNHLEATSMYKMQMCPVLSVSQWSWLLFRLFVTRYSSPRQYSGSTTSYSYVSLSYSYAMSSILQIALDPYTCKAIVYGRKEHISSSRYGVRL